MFDEKDDLWLKLSVSIGIFVVSLFAVSFPAISRRAKHLRIPSLVFFLGKHFGTGVILSTGFVHLLPDAFNSLKSKWTGLITLASLLGIFLVEYLTTAYVDHLHSYPSAPPSPSHSRSRTSSRTSEPTLDCPSVHEETPLLDPSMHPVVQSVCAIAATNGNDVPVVEVPTALSRLRLPSSAIPKMQDFANTEEEAIFGGAHHRHEMRDSHASHSVLPPMSRVGGVAVGKKVAALVFYDNDSEEERSKQQQAEEPNHRPHHHAHPGGGHGHGHSHSHHSHGHVHLDMGNWHDAESSSNDGGDEELEEEVKIGRRRQVVGILILQIGIMLHSLVIGLTMSVSSGTEFTTLVTAIMFHQVFEGLSLGIRIAALPSEASQGAFSNLPARILKPLLTLTFALTTPAGLWIGLAVFTSTAKSAPHLKEMQGLLSAMSAGMLIYAACVEMLAGDFVMDPTMWRSGLRRQATALISLVVGVAAMSAIE
ncbi:Zinc/iron permease [Cytidiella melzeri]|nr:Zinc/iron permease [Cytidiella melzeri]